jgi:DNA-directed RNA polymerase subunit RPC12/RpoP
MNARYGTKACRDCGQEFAKSAADSTVRCPRCRHSTAHAKVLAQPEPKLYRAAVDCRNGTVTYRTYKAAGIKAAHRKATADLCNGQVLRGVTEID